MIAMNYVRRVDVYYLSKIPLNAIPNGTPTEYVKLMIPMRTVRLDSFVISAI